MRPLPGLSAAGLRRKLGQWLRQVGDIGVVLVEEVGRIAWRRKHQGEPVRVNLDHVWDRVARALLWMRALEARLRAEARAANAEKKAAAGPGGDFRDSDYEAPEDLLRRRRWLAEPRPARAAENYDCIAGMPLEAVMVQICTDLGIAAQLLGREADSWCLWNKHKAVPNLLARLIVPRPDSAAADPAATPAAAARPRAPDTG